MKKTLFFHQRRKMLSLKEIATICKEKNIEICKEGDYYYLMVLPKEDKKKYEKWKAVRIAHIKKQNKNNKSYYTRFPRWGRYIPQEIPNEDQLKQQYQNSLKRESISFNNSSSNWSCAIYEFGGFNLASNGQDYWDLLLSYFLQNSKKHF